METTKNEHLTKTLKISDSKKDLLFEAIFSLTIFFIMLIIISNPKRYTSGTIEGLRLFFTSVLPGLFPFMLLTKLLTELGFILRLSQKLNKPANFLFCTKGISFYVLIMSILSGYPIGAKIICDLHEKGIISQDDAKKMAVFCTTSGPIFVIGAIGVSMFGSATIGIIIYLAHIVSSIILGIIYGHLKKSSMQNTHNAPLLKTKKDNIFGECVLQTITSLFVVGSYITIFYLIGELLDGLGFFNMTTTILEPITKLFNLDSSNTKGMLYGFLEVTRGAKELAKTTSILSICACTGILSFSGISIIMQSMVFLKQAKIIMHNFIFAKVMHSILSIILCYILCLIFIWNWWSYIVNCVFKFISISLYNGKVLV